MRVEKRIPTNEIIGKEGERHWEIEVLDFGRAPAFFIPFSSPDKESLEKSLLYRVALYNNLLAQGIPAFLRTFGINGYLFNISNQFFNNRGENLTIGLPVKGDRSFAIISQSISNPMATIYNAGSSGIVAAYKGFYLLNQEELLNGEENIEGNIFRISIDYRMDNTVCDHKGIPLEILPKNCLLEEDFRDQSCLVNQDVLNKLRLPASSQINKEELNSAVALKIDVNGSTREKLDRGDWFGREQRHTFFLMFILDLLKEWLSELRLVDPLGESMLIICPNLSLVDVVQQALAESLDEFPDISCTAVGIELGGLTIYRVGDYPIFYDPYIKEKNSWHPLERRYKEGNMRGTFLIT